jgi:nucleotide-binding universal stress UspA family protein
MFNVVVVGTDGSETATKAVAEAADLCRTVGARLLIVSAFTPVSPRRLEAEASEAPQDAQWMVHAREEVEQTLDEAKVLAEEHGLKVEAFARRGDPADAILDVAEEQGADLIVVGNKGMTGAKRFLLGSVPNKISHHAPCSVLIIRTT